MIRTDLLRGLVAHTLNPETRAHKYFDFAKINGGPNQVAEHILNFCDWAEDQGLAERADIKPNGLLA